MPNFVALGCVEVGEKFLGGWGHFNTVDLIRYIFISILVLVQNVTI